VIEAFRHKADHKEIVIIFKNLLSLNDDGEFLFKTDPYQLQLILSNLLSNSIEYSYAASEIELEINYVDNQLIVSFSDKGVGIDEKDQKIIFDRFTRLDTSINSIQQGHGLGLAITKNLIDALNGKIELVSRKRVGSVFKIFVPEGKENEFGEMYALNSDEFLFNDMENF
jgi:signal transduction histidine kinase